MLPGYRSGDYIITSSFHTRFKPGDVIVLNHPTAYTKLVKRVSRIEDDRLFVLGDNRLESQDSRAFGSIDKKQVIGKVVFKI
jgi:signal peptidase I